MANLMKLRLRCDGPEAWKLRIEDIETGKLLPVMGCTIDVHDNVMTVTATLMVSDIDIEGVINISEMMRQIAQEPETVDDFAARTVALVLDGQS